MLDQHRNKMITGGVVADYESGGTLSHTPSFWNVSNNTNSSGFSDAKN